MPSFSPRVILLKSAISKPGGLEKYALKIAQAFCKKGCEVTLVTSGPLPQSLQGQDIRCVTYTPLGKMSFFKVIEYDRFCEKFLKENKADIIFGLDRNQFQTHLRAGNGVHAAYLQQRRQTDGFFKRLSYGINPLHRSLLKIEKKSFEHPELKTLFTNSHMVRNEVLSYYATDPAKVQVAHNGVEWSEMQKDFDLWKERRKEILSELHLDPDCYQFIFIGHNFLRKGLDRLLEALPLIPHKNFQLSVIGKDKNVPYYKELCRKFGLEKQVHFFGPRTDIRSFYQMADALAIPSFYDPFANVTVEALAMGLFVISSNTNGGHEVLTPQNGAIIPSLNDIDSIAASLKIALEHPKTWQSALAIRNSARDLDFPRQLDQITGLCLG